MAKKTFDLSELEQEAGKSNFNRPVIAGESGESIAPLEGELNEVKEILEETVKTQTPVKKATVKKTAAKKTAIPALQPHSDTVIIEQVAFPKAASKNNWTKVSVKLPPDTARAVAHLMQTKEAFAPSVQAVFERFAQDAILEAAKDYGFIPDPD